MTAPTIRKLEIKGFRGIRSLVWSPHSRLNVILGAADRGKSTILEALALLFSTSPSQGLSEFDYHLRDLRSGFSIEAVLAIGDEGLVHDEGFPALPMQGWLGGKVTDLPDEDGAEPVIVCSRRDARPGDALRDNRRRRRNSRAFQPGDAPADRPGAARHRRSRRSRHPPGPGRGARSLPAGTGYPADGDAGGHEDAGSRPARQGPEIRPG